MDPVLPRQFLWLLFSVLITVPMVTGTGKVKMRIVHETANYGYYASSVTSIHHQPLIAKVKPANFSGPEVMKQFYGKCYNTTIDRYLYIFCPFFNMTQYETTPRWNAYQGILGIWGYWRIQNSDFRRMVMTHGDSCGDVDRTVEVLLSCGKEEGTLNVTEPSNCHYEAVFRSKFFCTSEALLVYPTLNADHQKIWDKLWTDFHFNDLSYKGYNASLYEIFKEVGYVTFNPEYIDNLNNESSDVYIENENQTFSSLGICNSEYDKLKKEMTQLKGEMDSLKVLLDLNRVCNRTFKPAR